MLLPWGRTLLVHPHSHFNSNACSGGGYGLWNHWVHGSAALQQGSQKQQHQQQQDQALISGVWESPCKLGLMLASTCCSFGQTWHSLQILPYAATQHLGGVNLQQSSTYQHHGQDYPCVIQAKHT